MITTIKVGEKLELSNGATLELTSNEKGRTAYVQIVTPVGLDVEIVRCDDEE